MNKRADIKTGFNCNNRCQFCVQGNKRDLYGNKTTEEVKKILDDAKLTCDGIVFTGGEVTIRPDVIELVKYAKHLGFKSIQIQTNGRRFAYKDFCLQLIQAGANQFSPALHGHTAELHDKLTQVPGSFKQVIAGIKNLRSLHQYILTNTVIVEDNYKYLPEIAKVLIEAGVNQYQFAFVHALGSAGENFENIVPRKSAVAPYLKQALEIGIQAGVNVMSEAMPYCFLLGYEKYIAENIMPETKIYDAREVIESFKEARTQTGKSKHDKCRQCKYDNVCEGPWREYPEHYGWDEFIPVS